MGILSGWILSVCFLGGVTGLEPGEGTDASIGLEPVARLRLMKPDQLHRALLGLSAGTRYPDPAAALTAYVQTRGGLAALGLPRIGENLWAFLNAGVTADLRRFDQMSLTILGREVGQDRASGIPWIAAFPADDGVIQDMALALALTEGEVRRDGSWDAGWQVDREGRVYAQSGAGGLILASDRALLESGRRSARPVTHFAETSGPGMECVIKPTGGKRQQSEPLLRWLEAVSPVGMNELAAWMTVEGDTAQLLMKTRWAPGRLAEPAALSPGEKGIRRERLGAVWQCAVETTAAGRNAFFEAWDRLEKLDPARAKTAAVRTRLNLFLGTLGLHPEREVWPGIRGSSGWLEVDESGRIAGGCVVLLFDQAQRVERISRALERPGILGGFAGALGGGRGPGEAERGVVIRGEGVRLVVCWGDPAGDEAGRAEGDVNISEMWPAASEGLAGWDRAVVVWPGAWVKTIPLDSVASAGLKASGPIVWVGRTRGDSMEERITWSGLSRMVRSAFEAVSAEREPRGERGAAP